MSLFDFVWVNLVGFQFWVFLLIGYSFWPGTLYEQQETVDHEQKITFCIRQSIMYLCFVN